MKTTPFNLIHPRYWLTWLGLGVLYGISKLPLKLQLMIGRGLGHGAFYLLKRFRHIARINLALCFPELPELARKQLLKEHFKSLGMGLIEAAMAWWVPFHKLAPLLHVEGLEHLQEALARKQGVIILSGHFTSLDLCGRLFAHLFPIHVVYREQKNQVIDMLLKRHRNFKLMQPIHRHAVRQIIKALKKNAAIWYAADQDYGPAHSIFSPFFTLEAATITTPSRYAKQTHAHVVTLFYHRLPQSKGYQITISPMVKNFAELNETEATLYFNKRLEQAIRAHPEQYLWIHRRFKTRPAGEASCY
jgi:Kdo2-lipid IVA lauroyltransferase/acyltransferase